jgi:predicted RNase H-like nuclease (RuvC/YqgF family)
MQKLVDDWNQGIREAVDRYNKMRDGFKEQRAAARHLDVPVFLRDEPATLPLGKEYLEEQQKREAEEQKITDQTAEMDRMNAEYQKKIEELSQKMMANMQDQKVVQQITAEMQQLSTNLQKKMQQLFGNE